MFLIQKQTVGSSRVQASVSRAVVSMCPQDEELQDSRTLVWAVMRKAQGEALRWASLSASERHYHHQGSLTLSNLKTLLISQSLGTEGRILSCDLIFLHCSNYDTQWKLIHLGRLDKQWKMTWYSWRNSGHGFPWLLYPITTKPGNNSRGWKEKGNDNKRQNKATT